MNVVLGRLVCVPSGLVLYSGNIPFGRDVPQLFCEWNTCFLASFIALLLNWYMYARKVEK